MTMLVYIRCGLVGCLIEVVPIQPQSQHSKQLLSSYCLNRQAVHALSIILSVFHIGEALRIPNLNLGFKHFNIFNV